MKRMIIMLSVTLVLVPLISSMCLAQEEEKKVKALEFKIKGQLIPHPDKNDIKVMTDDFQTFTLPLAKGVRIDMTTRGELGFLATENEVRLPTGEVTYTLIDGKPVVTRITYTSGEKWKMEPPAKEE
jgi:hypothetical protein